MTQLGLKKEEIEGENDLKNFLEKEREKCGNKHRTAKFAPEDEKCLSRRFASFAVRDEEELIRILVIGREKSGKSSFIAGATQCPDFRYFVKKQFEVTLKVTADTRMSKMASFAPFTLQLTEISFEALNSSAHALEALRGGTYWAVVWTVDLSRLASKGGLKDELTHMRKILEEPLVDFGIRGVLVCCMKKQELFRVPLSSELITEDICSELLEEFYHKIDEWRENMDRVVQVTSPFPNNPPDLDSPQFYMNVKRSLRSFFIEEGIDVIPWGSHLRLTRQTAFPHKVGILFAGPSEMLLKTVTEAATGIPKRSQTDLSKKDEDKQNEEENSKEKNKEGEEAEKTSEVSGKNDTKKPKTAANVNAFLAMPTRKQYLLSGMKDWHSKMKIELSKEKMINFNHALFKSNDKNWTETSTIFQETYESLFKESKLDHLIVCMALENAERSAVDSTKRALGRIFSCLHHDPSVLILFTGTSEKTLDGEKPGSEFSIYQRRNSLTNTIHCHRATEVSIDNVNSALFWTVHKHLKKICGVDPQVVEELQPFHNSRSELKFGKDYSINVVSHDL